MKVRKIYRYFYQVIVGKLDPVKFAKKIGVNMGEKIHIYGKVSWGSEPWIIEMGNNIHITDGVRFITHDGGTLLFRQQVPDLELTKPIKLGNDVYIGNNVILLPGVKVGSRVIIGAGAVVTHDIPDNSVAVGVPAKVVKSADEYLEKATKESLHLGHLRYEEKDTALKNIIITQGIRKAYIFRGAMMKKILICTRMPHDDSYVGGVVSIILAYLRNEELFKEQQYTIDVFSYEPDSIVKKLPQKIENVLYVFLQRWGFGKRLLCGDVSIVNIHTSREFLFLKDVFLAKYAKKKHHIPVVLTIHVGDSSTVFNRIHCFKKQVINFMNRYVDKTVFLTDEIKKQFINLGLNEEKSEVLYNFHNLSFSNEKKDRLSKLHLIYIGAIHREKGILDLLQALVNMPEEDFHIDVCGKLTDQSIESEFHNLLNRLGGKAELCGYVSGEVKTQLLQRADVLILPSYHEGMPLVIMEALATGCAIISTPVGGTHEILHDENVEWVRVKNSKDIEKAIRVLSKDKERLEKMKSANKKYSELFLLEKNIERLCVIYDKVYQSSRCNNIGS